MYKCTYHMIPNNNIDILDPKDRLYHMTLPNFPPVASETTTNATFFPQDQSYTKIAGTSSKSETHYNLTSMATKDLIIYYCGYWEAVETICECLPQLDIVSSLTYIEMELLLSRSILGNLFLYIRHRNHISC